MDREENDGVRICMGEKSIKNSVFSGLFWKFGERIVAQGVSFVVSIILARILMPREYGLVSMVTVFITIADVFVTSGFSTSLIQKKNADETDFSSIFWCTLIVSIILYGILFVSAPLISSFYANDELTPVIRVFSIKILISAYNSIQHAYVSRHMIFKKFFYSTLGGTIVSGVVGIIMAVHGFGVWSLVAQYLVNSTIDSIILSFTVPWKPKFIFSMTAAKSLMSYGWKVLAADLIGTIYNNLRALLIGKYFSSEDLAFYNRGKQFPELISNNIDTTISSVLFPAMSNSGDNVNRVKELTRRSMKTTAYVIFPIMIGMAAVAHPMVMVLLTEKWESCIIYLQLICIAKAITTVSTANLQAMRAIGRSDIVLQLEFIKKPVGLLMIIFAIRYGVLAIAVSMPIYSLFAMIVNMWPNRKLLNYSIREQIIDLLPTTGITIVMCLAVKITSVFKGNDFVQLIIQVLVGGSVYLLLSIVTKNDSFAYILSYAKSFLKRKEVR